MSKLSLRDVAAYEENSNCREKIERKRPSAGGKSIKKTLHDKRKK